MLYMIIQTEPFLANHAEFRDMSSCASIHSVHLDCANVYNLSLLLHSRPPPAFSDHAICWKSIDKLANALIDLSTTGRYWHRGLIDAIQLYYVSITILQPSFAFITSSLRTILSAVIAQIGTEQSDLESLDAVERMIGHFVDGDPFHFSAFSYLSLHGIAEHMIKKGPHQHATPRVKQWYRKSFDSTASGALSRLEMVLVSARITEIGDADFNLEAYEAALWLLQLHISATHTTAWAETVEHLLTFLAADAAAVALRLGESQVNKAVESSEWGRATSDIHCPVSHL
jgi:hypothetical protein